MKVVLNNALVTRNGSFIYPAGQELSQEELFALINYNTQNFQPKYRRNMRLYLSKHKILNDPPRQMGPHNKLVADIAKYIVDTYNGYFLGIPPRISLPNSEQNENDKLQDWLTQESFVDKLNEISKQADIYGRSYGFIYQRPDASTGFACVSPAKSFMVYDDSIERKPLAFVRYEYYKNENDYQARGTIYYANHSYSFANMKLDTQPIANPYGMIPAAEFYENEERSGVFDPVITLMDALDRALSQKANQVEYFDNAYLVMLGVRFGKDPKTGKPKVPDVKNNRLLIIPNTDPNNKPTVQFLSKPDADSMQEHYIDRLTNLIYQISMVPNMSDENFAGNASGVALEYKYWSMQNKAANKERKFTKSLRSLFEAIFSTGQVVDESAKNDWSKLTFQFTRNLPQDLASEIAAAKNAQGMISQRTQLGLLPFVSNPDQEIQEMQKEQSEQAKQARANMDDLPDFEKEPDGDAGLLTGEQASQNAGKIAASMEKIRQQEQNGSGD